MDKYEIIDYVNKLKKEYNTRNPFVLAEKLGYVVKFINTDPKFMSANTYDFKSKNTRIIFICSSLDLLTQTILCAHELGHCVLQHPHKSSYKDNNLKKEYGANLFAVALLFDQNDFNTPFLSMSNYCLDGILEENMNI